MTDFLSKLRGQVEAATPGEWAAWDPDDGVGAKIVRTTYTDSTTGFRTTAYPAVCNCGAQPNEANAALIVSAHRLAQFVVSEEAVEKIAAAIRKQKREGSMVAEALARAVCALLARAAVGDET